MIHHGFKKGKRVLVILKNNQEIIGKFVDSSSQYLTLDNTKIPWKDIRATTIFKNRNEDIL